MLYSSATTFHRQHHIILQSVEKVTGAKFDEVFEKTRALFVTKE
jgi:hypothetical protein